jgi:division protein CdvB (Snf7/Vps24/ESCRT-III family)
MNLTEPSLIAMIKVTGSLQKSTEIMKLSNALVKLPQISQSMREMSMEMTKVNIYSWLSDNADLFEGWHYGGDAGGHTRYGRRRRPGR